MAAQAYRERRIAAQDGLMLYYRDYGDPNAVSTPVLCLGGLTRNSKDAHTVALRLSQQRRVLCPDYRGRGKSAYDPNPANYRAETYGSDVIQVLDAANVHKVVVIGTSLGGLLGMALAVFRPAALAGVIMNDIGPDIPEGGASRIAGYIGTAEVFDDWQSAGAALRERHAKAYPDLEEDFWLALAKDTYAQSEDGKIRTDYDVALAKSFRSGADIPPLWPMFRALKNIPVLAIRGGLSDVLSAETLDKMAQEKPDLVRVTIANRGHVPLLDEPEAAAAIDEFLAGL